MYVVLAPGQVTGIISAYPIVVWNQPERPNGVITGYRLIFRRGSTPRTRDTTSDQTYYVIRSGDVPGTSGNFTVTVIIITLCSIVDLCILHLPVCIGT